MFRPAQGAESAALVGRFRASVFVRSQGSGPASARSEKSAAPRGYGISEHVSDYVEGSGFGCRVAVVLALTGVGACGRAPAELPKATGPMPLEEARTYVLALVNADRTDAGLDPVERDEVAERAGQRHAE